MRGVFAVVLVLGILGLFSWIVAVGLSGNVESWGWMDPERRFGARGRRIVAAMVGFGMGGMSSVYAGWPTWLVVLASVAAAGGAAWWATYAGGEAD